MKKERSRMVEPTTRKFFRACVCCMHMHESRSTPGPNLSFQSNDPSEKSFLIRTLAQEFQPLEFLTRLQTTRSLYVMQPQQ